jgi:hypothetical protein
LLAVTFTALILVAADEVRKKRVRREQLRQAADPEAGRGPRGSGLSPMAETPLGITQD